MSYIKSVLMNYRDYLQHNRGVGHTKILMQGIENTEDAYILVAHSLDYGNRVIREAGTEGKTLYYRYPENIYGYLRPIAFDNYALELLFNESITYMQELEKKVAEQKREIENLKRKIEGKI